MHFKTFLHSFQPRKEHLTSLVTDGITGILLWGAFSFFAKLIQKQALAISGGDPAQLQQLLLQLNPEEAQALLLQTKVLLAEVIGGGLLLLLFGLFFFSFTRAYLWNVLLGKQLTKKTYWRWNGLHLFLVFFLGMYLLLTLLLSFLVDFLTPAAFIPYVTPLVHAAFLVLFLLFVFLLGREFTLHYEVLQSVGKALHHFRSLKTWKIFFFGLFTALLPFALLTLLKIPAESLPSPLILNGGITLLYLSWFRILTQKNVSPVDQNSP